MLTSLKITPDQEWHQIWYRVWDQAEIQVKGQVSAPLFHQVEDPVEDPGLGEPPDRKVTDRSRGLHGRAGRDPLTILSVPNLFTSQTVLYYTT